MKGSACPRYEDDPEEREDYEDKTKRDSSFYLDYRLDSSHAAMDLCPGIDRACQI